MHLAVSTGQYGAQSPGISRPSASYRHESLHSHLSLTALSRNATAATYFRRLSSRVFASGAFLGRQRSHKQSKVYPTKSFASLSVSCFPLSATAVLGAGSRRSQHRRTGKSASTQRLIDIDSAATSAIIPKEPPLRGTVGCRRRWPGGGERSSKAKSTIPKKVFSAGSHRMPQASARRR